MYPSRILATNQPYGHGGSRGLAGRSGSGNPGGVGSGGRNPTTPTGMYNSGTTFQVGDVVMLLTNCGPNFPKDSIVEIILIEPTPESATKRPGQDVLWTQRDEDSVYRFQRRYFKADHSVIMSEENPDPISHRDLAPRPGLPCSDDQYPLKSVLCTLKDKMFVNDSNHNLVQVPKHTLCQVVDYTTRKGGRRYGKKMQNGSKCFYILHAKYLTYSWDTEICNRKKEVSNFRALTSSELRQYRARQLPASQVIPWQ